MLRWKGEEEEGHSGRVRGNGVAGVAVPDTAKRGTPFPIPAPRQCETHTHTHTQERETEPDGGEATPSLASPNPNF